MSSTKIADVAGKKSSGVTLIELMVVISIMSILLGLAVPSFKNMVDRQASRALTSDFISSIAYAKSESVRRGESVKLMAGGNVGDWSDGWCITHSEDCTGGVIKHYQPADRATLKNLQRANAFVFNDQGFLVSPAVDISVCADHSGGKIISITAIGQALAQDCNCNGSGHCE